MKRTRRRKADQGIVPDGTSGLPPAGADHSLFGTVVDMPFLERKTRDEAARRLSREHRRAERRLARRRLRARMRRGLRPSAVVLLDVAGIAGVLYASWLIWVPLAWALAGVVCLVLAWLLDTPAETGGE